jgi:hypothetical protein
MVRIAGRPGNRPVVVQLVLVVAVRTTTTVAMIPEDACFFEHAARRRTRLDGGHRMGARDMRRSCRGRASRDFLCYVGWGRRVWVMARTTRIWATRTEIGVEELCGKCRLGVLVIGGETPKLWTAADAAMVLEEEPSIQIDSKSIVICLI